MATSFVWTPVNSLFLNKTIKCGFHFVITRLVPKLFWFDESWFSLSSASCGRYWTLMFYLATSHFITQTIKSRVIKTFNFLLVLRASENTDVFIRLDEDISGIHFKRVNFLHICGRFLGQRYHAHVNNLLERAKNFRQKMKVSTNVVSPKHEAVLYCGQ